MAINKRKVNTKKTQYFMNYEELYNTCVGNTSNNICNIWPEKGFIYASWKKLAVNIENVYKAHGDAPRSIPHSVRIGYMDETREGMSLVKIKGTPSIEVPLLFDWSYFRGLCLCSYDIDGDGDASPISIVNKVGSSLLLRILLQADQESVLIHKVDPKGMGQHMGLIPSQPQAPVIVDETELSRLLVKLRSQIANTPVDAHAWRCDSDENAFASDSIPIQIVFIANWEDLYRKRGGEKELSDSQKIIIDMVKSDIPARNGIYFFICGTKDDALKQFCDSLPTLAIDDMNFGGRANDAGHRAQLYSKVPPDKINGNITQKLITQRALNCRFYLPTNEELIAVQKVYRNFLSGTLVDAEGDGVWQANSAKGLRAIMGITSEGENQFFELGIGKAYDAFHALIGGATGSGKSVLISEIICSLAERYSPKELRMLLLDYKEGTEFAPFADLPHVYALSLGPNPEFGLEVLKEVQKEISQRGILFKEVNAKNLDEYRKITGSEMCRYVLVADEFQILMGDKKFGEEARTVLNDLVCRGRSFGFHAILATQTLRDGSLDGEAKNQFGCRIAMRMAESETDYFLASGNTEPSTFTRKGQALVNYALGRKESNIIFQSGNKGMPKKFRDTPEVLACVNEMRAKAEEENCLPSDVYIYNSDGFADMPTTGLSPDAGALIGLRNNIQGTPVYLSKRQLEAKVLVLGGPEKKRNVLLNLLAKQASELYTEQVMVQTPGDYLDYPTTGHVTILNVPEGDFDLEEAVAAWKEAGADGTNSSILSVSDMGMAMPEMSSFSAPQGMEDDFAELMSSMQNNNAMLNATAQSTTAPRRGRNRDTRCLILAIGTSADVKLMEAAGIYTNDFRTIIYLDHVIYNQISGEYENTALGEAAAMLESPRGVVTKIRLIK